MLPAPLCGIGDARRTSHRVANPLCSLLSPGAGMESYLGTFFTVKGQHRGGNSELAYASFLSNPSSRTDVLKQARALTLNLKHSHPKPRVCVLPVHPTSRKDVLKKARQVTFVPRPTAAIRPPPPPPHAGAPASVLSLSLSHSRSCSLTRSHSLSCALSRSCARSLPLRPRVHLPEPAYASMYASMHGMGLTV
jgi:hypothetical protein